ncbi:MAG TPA: DUF4173 domain-containing protein [Candidatus Methylomirabilis sp.]|nr:DUF4173 domain-containing protein [Candidatus Methylomirabilis sp.]
MNARGTLWIATLAVAAIGAWVLWAAAPGPNWGLWALAASAGGLACAKTARAGLGVRSELACLGCALAAGAAITADPFFHVLIFLGVLWLFALAALLAGDPRAERISLPLALVAPVAAMARVLPEATWRAGELVTVVGTQRHRPLLRGGMLALVVVGVFAIILAGADPLLAALRFELVQVLDRFEFIPRCVFFVALLVVALGSYGTILRPGPVAAALPSPAVPTPRWADVERIIVFGAVALLFALFLGLQLAYLFGNAPALADSGVTFAEYARRGFAELTIVASLCTLLILRLEGGARRGPREPAVRGLALTLVGLLWILLLSAFRRLWLYEEAYGFTTARLYAQAYMAVVAFALLMLIVELLRGLDAKRLLRHTVAAGVLTVVLLSVWNHESWIAGQNLERAGRGGSLDVHYLVWHLSLNAVPTLVSALDHTPVRGSLREALQERYSRGTRASPCVWFEWNLRQRQAVHALRAAGLLAEDGARPAAFRGCIRIAPSPPRH